MSPFFHSIRWRLQVWHGALLLTVLIVFGSAAFYLARDARLRRIDQELQKRLAIVSGAVRPPQALDGPGGFRPGLRPGIGLPPGPGPNPGTGPRRGFDGLEPPGPAAANLPFEFRMPPESGSLFDDGGKDSYYFAVWFPNGARHVSATAPTNLPPPETGFFLTPAVRTRDMFRELVVSSRRGAHILVGHSLVEDLAEFRRIAWLLGGAGAGVLLLGLAGGWWLAGRAMRPVELIGAAAQKISAGNLAERIGVADTEGELGRLAGVLNNTFDRLQAAFARQAQFTADASHELRTPVSVVLSQAQTALSRERTPGEYRESLEACQRAAQRMRQLIDSMLVLARIDSGAGESAREPLRLDRLAGEAVEMLRSLAVENGVALRTSLEPAAAVGDADQVGRAVLNLVSNAIHYNRPGGEVAVETAVRDGTAALTVRDTGIGIPPEDLPHIFERFYRADKSRSRSQGRAGLGLSIAKAVVDAHGGRLEASSEPGRGSIFTVRLPAG